NSHGLQMDRRRESADRTSTQRRCENRAEFLQASQGSLQRPRDGRGGERQDMDGFGHSPELLLVSGTESLFFVDDKETQFRNGDIAARDGVGAHDNPDA